MSDKKTRDREVVYNNRPNELLLPAAPGAGAATLRPGRNEVDPELWARALGYRPVLKWVERGWLSQQGHHRVVVARPQTEFPVDPETGKARPVFRADAETGLVLPSGESLVRSGAVDRELLARARRAVAARNEERASRRAPREVAPSRPPDWTPADVKLEARDLVARARREAAEAGARAEELRRELEAEREARAREVEDLRRAVAERDADPEIRSVAERASESTQAPADALSVATDAEPDAAAAASSRGRSRRGS